MLVGDLMEELVTHLKTSGYIFQGSEIYGGLANTWDYGPLGSILKNNLKHEWRKAFIQNMDNSYEVDAAILMHPRVWEASGHVSSFSDPLMDCKHCKTRHRADNLISSFNPTINPDTLSILEMQTYIEEQQIPCPNCGKHNFTDIRQFNLMFKTNRGVVEDDKSAVYLRPENAQGEYVNYLNVMRSMRAKIPFAIGQIGKAFRNEITPGNFIFRTIEFEQMEYQVFCKPGDDEKLYEKFKLFAMDFINSLGIPQNKLQYKDHAKLAHYAKAACDVEYQFPFGWGEINGTHNRTDFDLTNHQNFSGQKMEYLDPVTNERYIPYIVESTYGADRLVLAVLAEAYTKDIVNDEERIVLRLLPKIAPYKVAILPLAKKYHSEEATKIYQNIRSAFMTIYDETGSIGKRYRRQDAIGTPFCITIDEETLSNNTVTIRERDTMEQVVIPVAQIIEYINTKIR